MTPRVYHRLIFIRFFFVMKFNADRNYSYYIVLIRVSLNPKCAKKYCPMQITENISSYGLQPTIFIHELKDCNSKHIHINF